MRRVVPYFSSFLYPFLRCSFSKTALAVTSLNILRNQGPVSLHHIQCFPVWTWDFSTSLDTFAKSGLFPNLSPSLILRLCNESSISVYYEELMIPCPASFIGCYASFYPVLFFSTGIIGKLTTFIEFLQSASYFLGSKLDFSPSLWVYSVLWSMISSAVTLQQELGHLPFPRPESPSGDP